MTNGRVEEEENDIESERFPVVRQRPSQCGGEDP